MKKAFKIGWRTALALIGCFILSTRADTEVYSLEGNLVPEYYRQPSETLCVSKVELRNNNLQARRILIMRDLATTYGTSNEWRSAPYIIGVDYSEFKSFLIVFRGHCGEQSPEYNTLHALLNPADVRVTVVTDTPYVSTTSVRAEYPNGSALFFHFLGGDQVKRCLLLINSENYYAALESYKKLLSAWRKYRLPIADAMHLDNKIYILLSRDCERKALIFDGITLAVKQDFPSTGIGPMRLNLSPETTEYLQLRLPGVRHTPYMIDLSRLKHK